MDNFSFLCICMYVKFGLAASSWFKLRLKKLLATVTKWLLLSVKIVIFSKNVQILHFFHEFRQLILENIVSLAPLSS